MRLLQNIYIRWHFLACILLDVCQIDSSVIYYSFMMFFCALKVSFYHNLSWGNGSLLSETKRRKLSVEQISF